MRNLRGLGGSVYAAGDAFAFTGLPLADLGDGFTWRGADPSLHYWVTDSAFSFEALEHGEWFPVEPLEVRHAAATVRFGRCLTGLPVRCAGTALPTTLVAEGARWELRQPVLLSRSLGVEETVLGRAVARLFDVTEDMWSGLGAVGRAFAVLPSATVGAFVGLGEFARDGSSIKFIFDERGVSYAG